MDVEGDRLEIDILFVGAGPATLASAIRVVDLCKEKGIDPPAMLVIEKASEIGEHQLSGAVMNGEMPPGQPRVRPALLGASSSRLRTRSDGATSQPGAPASLVM